MWPFSKSSAACSMLLSLICIACMICDSVKPISIRLSTATADGWLESADRDDGPAIGSSSVASGSGDGRADNGRAYGDGGHTTGIGDDVPDATGSWRVARVVWKVLNKILIE